MSVIVSDYEINQLQMMRKFGPAVSSTIVEEREIALQELVKHGLATMKRSNDGQINYIITREGQAYLDELKA